MTTKPKSSAIEFTPEDVEANRQGRLSECQESLLYMPENILDSTVNSRVAGLVLLWVLLMGYFWFKADYQMMSLTALEGPIFLCLAVFTLKSDKPIIVSDNSSYAEQVVLQIAGKPHFETQQGSAWIYLRVQSLTFKISPETAAFFTNPGTYRVYYLSGTGRFLSAEYLGDGLFK